MLIKSLMQPLSGATIWLGNGTQIMATPRKRKAPVKKTSAVKGGLTAAAGLITGTVFLQILTAVSYVGVCEYRASKQGQCTFQWLVLGAFVFGGGQTVAALFVQAARTTPAGASTQLISTLANALLSGSQGAGAAPGEAPPVIEPTPATAAPRGRRTSGARSTTRENQIG